MTRISSVVLLACVVFATAAVPCAQQIHLPASIAQPQGMGAIPVSTGDEVQRQQWAAANQQRQIEIRRDSEKMAELTKELNADLQKDGKTMLSADVIKKAEQIEKLAKSVRSKMKQSF